eukprot:1247477-Amphidinium_carterae.1
MSSVGQNITSCAWSQTFCRSEVPILLLGRNCEVLVGTVLPWFSKTEDLPPSQIPKSHKTFRQKWCSGLGWVGPRKYAKNEQDTGRASFEDGD